MLRIRLLEQECLELLSERYQWWWLWSRCGRQTVPLAATGKARSPRMRRRVIGTSSAADDPERSLRRESTSAAVGIGRDLKNGCARGPPSGMKPCLSVSDLTTRPSPRGLLGRIWSQLIKRYERICGDQPEEMGPSRFAFQGYVM